MKKNLNNINLIKLESALRSDIFETTGHSQDFKMVFYIFALIGDIWLKDESDNFEYLVNKFEKMKNMDNFNTVQFRAYGYYGENPFDGRFEILEESSKDRNTNYRIHYYDKD